jgi:glutaredoxin 3
MKKVEIYTSPYCGYCHAAKRLLSSKGVQFTEYDVSRDPAKRQEMMNRAPGKHTVPQIFVGKTHIGGSDELHALEYDGKFDPMLSA